MWWQRTVGRRWMWRRCQPSWPAAWSRGRKVSGVSGACPGCRAQRVACVCAACAARCAGLELCSLSRRRRRPARPRVQARWATAATSCLCWARCPRGWRRGRWMCGRCGASTDSPASEAQPGSAASNACLPAFLPALPTRLASTAAAELPACLPIQPGSSDVPQPRPSVGADGCLACLPLHSAPPHGQEHLGGAGAVQRAGGAQHRSAGRGAHPLHRQPPAARPQPPRRRRLVGVREGAVRGVAC